MELLHNIKQTTLNFGCWKVCNIAKTFSLLLWLAKMKVNFGFQQSIYDKTGSQQGGVEF